jgi:tetratricopeptide (TPR) repeat protein
MTEERKGFPWLTAGWVLLVVSGAILAAVDSPTIAYVALALGHVGGGVVWLFPLGRSLARREGSAWLRAAAGLAWTASAGTAIFLMARGNLTVYRPVLRAHVIASVLGSALLLVLWSRGLRLAAPRERRLVQAGGAALAIALVAVPGWNQWRRVRPRAADRVLNPVAPASMEAEGLGPQSPFFPSSVRTDPGGHIDAKFFLDSEACGRCHPDVFKQWNESAHHFSSFNNQWYRKSIEYMQSVAGVPASRWCAGCHDPAPLFSGLMDRPIQEILSHPQAQAGLSCTACHAITRVHSTMGQGDYTIRYPPLHHLLTSGNPLLQKVHDSVTYLDPAPHRETFLRPFMRESSDRFCSGCHKVHLDVPVNSYRWFRGFNEYDAWQNSGISMNNARAFYHPKEARTCADCHMPRVPSQDPAAKSGMIRSHRFVAANTALPTANGHHEQLRLTQEFLQAGKVSVDIFAVSDAAEAAPVEQGPAHGDPALQAASFSTSEDVAPAARGGRDEGGVLRGPFRRAPVQVRRGESVRVEVVVRTRDVGHLFPGGTMDAFDVWLELQGVDESGRVVFWSGEAAEGGQGRVEPGAHRYHTALIDARGNPINKRNAWSARALVYARAIPPGAADTVHFRMKVPADCGDKITLQARLNYRKFSWWNTHWAFAGRRDPAQGAFEVSRDYDDGKWSFDGDTSIVSGPTKKVPDLPTTIVARDTQAIEVLPAGAPLRAAGPAFSAEDRGRWNDYAIGLLLQGNLKAAEAAFLTVTRLDPAYADGWVNVARCRLEEGDHAGARAVLDKALALDPALPKAHYFMGQALKREGQLEEALGHLRAASLRFPGDRVIHDEIGRVLFLQRRYAESVEALQKTLAIDPEDLAAHYNLMLSYRGLGDEEKAGRHEVLYRRFKADEPSQALLGPYLRRNPDDNNERQPIHEHRDARAAAPAAPSAKPARAYTKAAENR